MFHQEESIQKANSIKKYSLYFAGTSYCRKTKIKFYGFKGIKKSEDIDKENLLKYIQPQDIKKFGPIVFPVLTHRPSKQRGLNKNAIIKQYKKLFEMVKTDSPRSLS